MGSYDICLVGPDRARQIFSPRTIQYIDERDCVGVVVVDDWVTDLVGINGLFSSLEVRIVDVDVDVAIGHVVIVVEPHSCIRCDSYNILLNYFSYSLSLTIQGRILKFSEDIKIRLCDSEFREWRINWWFQWFKFLIRHQSSLGERDEGEMGECLRKKNS